MKRIIYLLIPLFIIIGYYLLHTEVDKETVEVAKVICAEACGEGYTGMYGVANVIANRAKLYNKTPYEIITQKNQFYGYTAKNKEKLFIQCADIGLKLSEKIMELDDITNGALYFKRPEEKIRAWHNEKTFIYKNHEFWK